MLTGRIEDEYDLAEAEASHWEKLRGSVQQLVYQVEECRDARVKESGDKLTPEHDKLALMLDRVMDFVDGRIEEQRPGSYKFRQEFYHCAGSEEREVLRYALQEGINAVALMSLLPAQRRDAVEYISEHGLASMNYEAASKAVIEYRIEDFARNYGIRLGYKEAVERWA